MARLAALIYGVACYVMFLGAFVYLCLFLGNIRILDLVPKTIDSGGPVPLWPGALVNLGLLALFGIQHSVMARPTFKEAWTRLVPRPVERSTYVLFTNIVLIILFWGWQPTGGWIWHVEHPVGRGVLWAVFGIGWGLVFVATVVINHFDLFGLRQVWLYFRGVEYTHIGFKQPLFYKYIRHPLYVGWLLAFWGTPDMTSSHLTFAAGSTAYILIAIRFEERNLIQFLGEDYVQYRRRAGMLLPRLSRRPAAGPATAPGETSA